MHACGWEKNVQTQKMQTQIVRVSAVASDVSAWNARKLLLFGKCLSQVTQNGDCDTKIHLPELMSLKRNEARGIMQRSSCSLPKTKGASSFVRILVVCLSSCCCLLSAAPWHPLNVRIPVSAWGREGEGTPTFVVSRRTRMAGSGAPDFPAERVQRRSLERNAFIHAGPQKLNAQLGSKLESHADFRFGRTSIETPPDDMRNCLTIFGKAFSSASQDFGENLNPTKFPTKVCPREDNSQSDWYADMLLAKK